MGNLRVLHFLIGAFVGLGIARAIPKALAYDCPDTEQNWAFESPTIDGPPDGLADEVWSEEIRVQTDHDRIHLWYYEDSEYGGLILAAERVSE